jgi:hypothetical protein
LILLAGKILDNSQPVHEAESTVKQNCELIYEIFTKFIFPSVFEKEQLSSVNKITISDVIQQRTQSKSETSDQDSKKSAYKLVSSLVQRDPRILANFMETCMLPLMKSV